ncbi:hypothetical protein PGTUg99_000081 [Puccinia graminis f. sp. tritici]|uniref:Uncharacterized protein n=1 Tax=Puccinia graminis f. sp. tritici TaxID=56615 RepID=A0A5B0RZ28_PUCGR|nr:hypothetical protein PGTUg99_000081 [Puccinia graminis f. sp. tritici]
MCILFFFGPQSTSEPSSHSLSHQPHLVSSPQLPSTPPQYPQLLPHTVSSTPPASPKLYCPLHPQHYRAPPTSHNEDNDNGLFIDLLSMGNSSSLNPPK